MFYVSIFLILPVFCPGLAVYKLTKLVLVTKTSHLVFRKDSPSVSSIFLSSLYHTPVCTLFIFSLAMLMRLHSLPSLLFHIIVDVSYCPYPVAKSPRIVWVLCRITLFPLTVRLVSLREILYSRRTTRRIRYNDYNENLLHLKEKLFSFF